MAQRFRLAEAKEADAVVAEFWQEMTARENGDAPPDNPELILAIRNIGQFRSLRRDEDDYGMSGFGAAKEVTSASMLGDLIRKGPLVGISVVVFTGQTHSAMQCDGYQIPCCVSSTIA